MTALQLDDIAVQGRSRNRWDLATIAVYDPGTMNWLELFQVPIAKMLKEY